MSQTRREPAVLIVSAAMAVHQLAVQYRSPAQTRGREEREREREREREITIALLLKLEQTVVVYPFRYSSLNCNVMQ